ncbi:hypothetical protein BU14_0575s0010 [Porphyra umbilicalis]|uniref:Uncharacterized protein n=1 Tax=Porphyra umbilicalis TaxID=2786 RepID=A0A1X6NS68_PORUM|nr:hypothetical protein BU14_0575s0010 [Porphyra umbilicalis]|eukprot:OSX71223.1 hypothetical protein BU14_0575s0010 [Porphyra umbilicalis]
MVAAAAAAVRAAGSPLPSNCLPHRRHTPSPSRRSRCTPPARCLQRATRTRTCACLRCRPCRRGRRRARGHLRRVPPGSSAAGGTPCRCSPRPLALAARCARWPFLRPAPCSLPPARSRGCSSSLPPPTRRRKCPSSAAASARAPMSRSRRWLLTRSAITSCRSAPGGASASGGSTRADSSPRRTWRPNSSPRRASRGRPTAPRCWLAAMPARSSSRGRRGGSSVSSKAATTRPTMKMRGTAGGWAPRPPRARPAAGRPRAAASQPSPSPPPAAMWRPATPLVSWLCGTSAPPKSSTGGASKPVRCGRLCGIRRPPR